MRNAEKNRDPLKARKRAKNDAGTALRKLLEWAEEIGDEKAARDLVEAWATVKATAERLAEKSGE